jgi:hypothetical protein
MRASDEGSTERPVLAQIIRIAATIVTNQCFLLVIFLLVPNGLRLSRATTYCQIQKKYRKTADAFRVGLNRVLCFIYTRKP